MAKRSKVVGVRKLQANLKKRSQRYSEEVKVTLLEGSLLIQRMSQEQCPVDTGATRNSARTIVVRETDNRIEVQVRYGTVYAIFVHENLSARHEVGNAKFLEIPFRIESPRLIKRLSNIQP